MLPLLETAVKNVPTPLAHVHDPLAGFDPEQLDTLAAALERRRQVVRDEREANHPNNPNRWHGPTVNERLTGGLLTRLPPVVPPPTRTV